uniref:Uncharacterized protein n=1 Tax=Glossina brevipalpis TaxID=37001 RepID=A0A1A9X572_9MUSC
MVAKTCLYSHSETVAKWALKSIKALLLPNFVSNNYDETTSKMTVQCWSRRYPLSKNNSIQMFSQETNLSLSFGYNLTLRTRKFGARREGVLYGLHQETESERFVIFLIVLLTLQEFAETTILCNYELQNNVRRKRFRPNKIGVERPSPLVIEQEHYYYFELYFITTTTDIILLLYNAITVLSLDSGLWTLDYVSIYEVIKM